MNEKLPAEYQPFSCDGYLEDFETRLVFNTSTREWKTVKVRAKSSASNLPTPSTPSISLKEDYDIYFNKSIEKTMAKINFTKEHYAKMKDLAFEMLVNNEVVTSKFGSSLSIVDLMHTQSVNTLNNMRIAFSKQINDLENQDEWAATDYQQEKLEALKRKKELVNLIIGWKRHNMEVAEAKAKKAELTVQLKELKESQKTPEDRIKELEAQLTAIDADEDF